MPATTNARKLWILTPAFAIALSACGGPPGTPLQRGFAARDARGTASPIGHVVIIVQENRTVDDLFNGLPGADTVRSGENSHGQTVPLAPVPLGAPYDISHTHSAFETEYAGGAMDGFDVVHSACVNHGRQAKCPPSNVRAYGYVPQHTEQPYWDLAETYAFADEMFATNQGPSFPAHQYLVSGTSTIGYASTLRAAEEPLTASGRYTGGCDSPKKSLVQAIDDRGNENISVYPCFDRISLMQIVDEAHLSWRYYQARTEDGPWHAPDAIRSIRFGSSYGDVIAPPSRVLTDVADGDLANVVWVTPTAAESDHAGTTDGTGPDWVASVVNAIGASKFWSSTAIFVTWDDWGGWYDHVAPTIDNSYELGMRVPLLVISPYAKEAYVSHVHHEFGSILKFVEETFGLPSLGTTDVRSDDLSDCFDFAARARRYRHVRTAHSAEFFLRASSTRPPDDDL